MTLDLLITVLPGMRPQRFLVPLDLTGPGTLKIDLASAPATPRNSRPLLRQMAQRVIDGEFDASKEESDAWAASPEGQETFAQLVNDSVFGGMVKKMQEDK